MTDQCRLCTLRGDMEACRETNCFHTENWYCLKMKKKVAELEEKYQQSVELRVKSAHQVSAYSAALHYALGTLKDCWMGDTDRSEISVAFSHINEAFDKFPSPHAEDEDDEEDW